MKKILLVLALAGLFIPAICSAGTTITTWIPDLVIDTFNIGGTALYNVPTREWGAGAQSKLLSYHMLDLNTGIVSFSSQTLAYVAPSIEIKKLAPDVTAIWEPLGKASVEVFYGNLNYYGSGVYVVKFQY